MRRVRLLLVLLTVIVGGAGLLVGGQGNCPSNILDETNILLVERTIPGCAQQYSTWLSQIDDSLNDPNLGDVDRARALIYEGLIYLTRLQGDDDFLATQSFQESVVVAQRAGDQQILSLAYYYTGLAFYENRRFDLSENWFQTALNTAEPIGDSLTMGRVWWLRGLRALSEERYQDATLNLQNAFPHLYAVPNLSVTEQISALEAYADAHFELDNFSRARLFRAQAGALSANPDLYANLEASSELGSCGIEQIDIETDYIAVEHQLTDCVYEAGNLQAKLQTALEATGEDAERGRLLILSGLVYELQGEYFQAQRQFERAVVAFRAVNDVRATGIAFYYFGRAYIQNGQFEIGLTQLGQAEVDATTAGDDLTLGRVQLEVGRDLLNRVEDTDEAILVLEQALPNLRAGGDQSIPEQLDALRLLNQAYAILGNAERALQYDREYRALLGEDVNADTLTIFDDLDSCNLTSLANQLNVIYVEFSLAPCNESIPALMLTAEAGYYTTDDVRVQGLMKIYLGLGYARRNVEQFAGEALDQAIVHLQDIGDDRLLTLAHYYLAEIYLEDGREASGLQNLGTAEGYAEATNDYLTLGRIQYIRAERAYDAEQYTEALSRYEEAFTVLGLSPYPTISLQRSIANRVLWIYNNEVFLAGKVEEWTEIRASLAEDARGRSSASAEESAATPTTTAAAVEDVASDSTAATCNPQSLVALDTLVEFERQLLNCTNYETILQAAQTRLSQAAEADQEAYYSNMVGIVQYFQAQANGNRSLFYDAFLSHGRALNYYQSSGDQDALTRTYFYYGRSQLAHSNSPDALNFIYEAERRAVERGDARTIADVRRFFAENALSEGDRSEAITLLEEALEQYRASDYVLEEIQLLLQLAVIYNDASNFSVAQTYYETAAQLATNDFPDEYFVRAHVGLARFHKYFGRFEVASGHLDAAAERASTVRLRTTVNAERSSLFTAEGDFTEASALLSNIDETRLACALGDRVRVYRGNYLVAVGQASLAAAVYRQVLENDCATADYTTLAEAYAGLADAELVRRSEQQLQLEAVNDSRRANRELNPDPVFNYPRGEQRALLQEAEYYRRLREYDRVDRLVGNARRLAETNDDLRGLVDATIFMVRVNIDRGFYQEAANLLREATRLYSEMGYVSAVSVTFEQEVRIYLDQARYEDAISLIDSARDSFTELELPISFESRIIFYEGILEEQLGFTNEALVLYDQAQAGFVTSNEVLSQIEVNLRIVNLLHRRQQYDAARAILLDMRDLSRDLENSFYIAETERLLGDNEVLLFLEGSADIDAAEVAYNTALGLYTEIDSTVGLARTRLRLGEVNLIRLERGLARNISPAPDLNIALDLFRFLGNPLGEADVLLQLGRYQMLTGRYRDAINYFEQSLRVLGEFDPFRRSELYTYQGLAWEALYNLNGQQNDLVNAIDAYKQATELVGFVYTELGEGDAQRTFGTSEEALLPYNRLVYLYAMNPVTVGGRALDYAEALYYAEQSRARSYLSRLQGETIQLSDTEDGDLLLEWQQLRDETINLNRTLDGVTQSVGDAAETDTIRDQIDQNLARMEEIESQIDFSTLLQIFTIDVSNLEEIQASLPADTAMLVYYTTPERETAVSYEGPRIMTFVISRDSISLHPELVQDYEQDIINQVFRGILQNRNLGSAARLYDRLIAPVRDELSAYSNLIIVPHDRLNFIPFEMLTDGERFLIEDFVISYAPSATVYTLLQQSVRPGTAGEEQLLALGYSGFGYDELPELFYYDTEVRSVASFYANAMVRLGDEANATALTSDLANLSQVSVLHVAAHGSFDSADPLSSYLALAPGNDPLDGRLEVREIYELNLQRGSPLVVLSACDLAQGELLQGDELEGMTRAFLLTGARGVVASFWAVDDLTTADFMEDFYSRLSAGQSEAQALAESKREMIRLYPNNPGVWAGFVLVGLPN